MKKVKIGLKNVKLGPKKVIIDQRNVKFGQYRSEKIKQVKEASKLVGKTSK